MKITINRIADMKPCKERFDNFVKHYPGFSGDLTEFFNLDNITYNDKVWVGVRLLNRNQLVRWSIACAESVQPIFEKKYPNNKSLSNLFTYLKQIEDFTVITSEQRETIYILRIEIRNAAYAAADAAADAATYAATYAAADAAADAATYAAADAAADAATYAADAAYAQEEQRNLNLMLLASMTDGEE